MDLSTFFEDHSEVAQIELLIKNRHSIVKELKKYFEAVLFDLEARG